ncbi:SIS domain-containing protein [bacterium]|nr:SIS domain-containing protein [bacterium]
MKNLAEAYYREIERLLKSVKVTNREGQKIEFYAGIADAGDLIKDRTKSGSKLIFIGNGASAAISSHQATDFWKNGGMKAIAFNDSSLLTCISNDFGYKYVFEKPIEIFADSGDILLAISSSGRSENIIRAVDMARAKDVEVITLSGFKDDNPLRQLGNINFYIPSSCYGHIEVLHESISHCILDIIIQKDKESK